MKRHFAIALTLATLAAAPLHAEPPRTTRAELQRHDISIPGFEAIQLRVDFVPGAAAPRHTHPGEEIIYVLSGTLEYTVGSAQPVMLHAGDVLFVPAGVVHSARNLGDEPASELGTFIVEKGKPILTVVL